MTPEIPLRLDQMVCTVEAPAVIRVLREFEHLLSGGSASRSLAILENTPARFTIEECEDFSLLLDTMDTLSRVVDPALYAVIQQEPFRHFFWEFLETMNPNDDPEEKTLQLWEFLDMAWRGRLDEDQWIFDEMMRGLEGLGWQFTLLFKLHKATICARDMVIEKLGQTTKVATFITEGWGYRVTGAPEGYRVRLDTGTLVTLIAK